MSSILARRAFLARTWKIGVGLVGAAGIWSMWDLLQPLKTAGFGGKVRAISPRAVTEGTVREISAARSYLVHPPNGDIVALSWKCPHLGCKVPYCESSGRFECPCHGSVFNYVGEYLAGPSPRGMDHYPAEVGTDGLLNIDTGSRSDGPARGTITFEETSSGEACKQGES